MGLLDFNLTDPNLALAAGLLTGTGNLGANLSKGLLAANQQAMAQQQQERQNRQNDLQQLSGVYQLMRQQELPKMLTQGAAYVKPPEMMQLENRLYQLSGAGNLAGQARAAPPQSQQQPGQQPEQQSSVPPAVASQYSLAVDPGIRAQGPMPQPQAPQPQQQPQGGVGAPAGGIPMAQWLMVDPTGKSYFEQMAKDNAPVPLRQGDLVGRNPDGSYSSRYQQPPTVPGVLPNRDANGQVQSFREAPGFAAAASNIKGAETGATEQAKAPFDFRPVTTASGAQVPMSVTQLMGSARPGQPPQPPGQLGVAQLTVTQPSRQAQARPQGQPNDPWATMPTIPLESGLGQGTYQKGLADQRSNIAKETALDLGTNAAAASSRIAVNNQAKDLVDSADTGWLANHLSEFRNILGTLGVQSAADKATTDQALAKDLTNTALQKGKQLFGSRFTQSEVGIMLSRANPSPEMQKAAIKFLLDTDNATQQYAIKQGNDFGRFINQRGDPLQFKQWYAGAFPMTDVTKNIPIGNEPQNIDDLVKRYYRP